MVNAPTIFSVAWAAILPFANDYVRAKLHLSRHAETELLSEICGPHGVPRSLGGTYEPPPDDAVTEEAPQGELYLQYCRSKQSLREARPQSASRSRVGGRAESQRWGRIDYSVLRSLP